MKKFATVLVVVGASFSVDPSNAQDELKCRTFEEIYGSAKSLCENYWGSAFRYVDENDPEYNTSYTMWFFDNENPNDQVTQNRIDAGMHKSYNNTDVCHVKYKHLDKPSTEPRSFTECHPWRNEACCTDETVLSADVLKRAYGEEYHWDRCGPLSPECERFFVQEACFYECDVNVGLFRKFHPFGNQSQDGYNEWQVEAMPIRADYCDSFYAACKNQLTCGVDNGDTFSCARVFVDPNDKPTEPPGPSVGVIAGFVVLSLVVAAAITFVVILAVRERRGQPLFGTAKLDFGDSEEEPTVQTATGSRNSNNDGGSVSQI